MKNVSSVPSSIARAAAKLAKNDADIISGANKTISADETICANKTISADSKTICVDQTICANKTICADSKTICADETISAGNTIIAKTTGASVHEQSISVARSHFVFTCFLRMALLLTLVACCGNLFSPSVLVIMALEGAPTHSATVSSSFPMRLSYGLLTAVDAYTTPPSTVLASIDKVTNDIADKEGHGGNEPSAITSPSSESVFSKYVASTEGKLDVGEQNPVPWSEYNWKWTKSKSGCPLFTDPHGPKEYACCKQNASQCHGGKVCTPSGRHDLCPFTLSTTGCSCYANRTDMGCACCITGGEQCYNAGGKPSVCTSYLDTDLKWCPYTSRPRGDKCYGFNDTLNQCAFCNPGGVQCNGAMGHSCIHGSEDWDTTKAQCPIAPPATCNPDGGRCNSLEHFPGSTPCCNGEKCMSNGFCPFASPRPWRFADIPAMMSHDSATGYINTPDAYTRFPDNNVFPTPSGTAPYTTLDNGCPAYQAQIVNFTTQLACGARVLDLRPYWFDQGYDEPFTKTWRFWHGPGAGPPENQANWIGGPTLKDSMKEIMAWANDNPDEIVILYFSHCNIMHAGFDLCQGTQAISFDPEVPSILSEMQSYGVPVGPVTGEYIHGKKPGDRKQKAGPNFVTATTSEVKAAASLGEGKGHVLAVINHYMHDTMSDNQCYGVGKWNGFQTKNNCHFASWTGTRLDNRVDSYTPSELNKETCMENMDTNVYATLQDRGASGPQKGLWQFQGIWQVPGCDITTFNCCKFGSFAHNCPNLTNSYPNGYPNGNAGGSCNCASYYWNTVVFNQVTQLNAHMANKWGETAKKTGGFWLADNVCEGGMDLAQSMGTKMSPKNKDICTAACRSTKTQCKVPSPPYGPYGYTPW